MVLYPLPFYLWKLVLPQTDCNECHERPASVNVFLVDPDSCSQCSLCSCRWVRGCPQDHQKPDQGGTGKVMEEMLFLNLFTWFHLMLSCTINTAHELKTFWICRKQRPLHCITKPWTCRSMTSLKNLPRLTMSSSRLRCSKRYGMISQG